MVMDFTGTKSRALDLSVLVPPIAMQKSIPTFALYQMSVMSIERRSQLCRETILQRRSIGLFEWAGRPQFHMNNIRNNRPVLA